MIFMTDTIAAKADGTSAPDNASALRPWQTPAIEIVPVSVTGGPPGGSCEGSLVSNTS